MDFNKEQKENLISDLKEFRGRLIEMKKNQDTIEKKQLIDSIIYQITKVIINSYGG